jgi:hypothetical protein
MPPPSLATINPFALLQDNNDNKANDPTNSLTTAASLSILDNDIDNITNNPTTAVAFSVLDQETGKFLKHRKLCRNPKHKPSWDKSYANKMGRLCQGVGTHP